MCCQLTNCWVLATYLANLLNFIITTFRIESKNWLIDTKWLRNYVVGLVNILDFAFRRLIRNWLSLNCKKVFSNKWNYWHWSIVFCVKFSKPKFEYLVVAWLDSYPLRVGILTQARQFCLVLTSEKRQGLTPNIVRGCKLCLMGSCLRVGKKRCKTLIYFCLV